jgi:hypothetical protein
MKIEGKKENTALNRIVNASPPSGGSGSVRLGRSLRSLPRLTAPQFASPGLASQALIRAGKPSFTTGNVMCHLYRKNKIYLLILTNNNFYDINIIEL